MIVPGGGITPITAGHDLRLTSGTPQVNSRPATFSHGNPSRRAASSPHQCRRNTVTVGIVAAFHRPSLALMAFAGLCATAVHERTTVSASSAGTDEALTDDPIQENYAMGRTLERSAASASGTVIMARSSKPPGSFTSRETSVAQYR
jgi:hypothetical protein